MARTLQNVAGSLILLCGVITSTASLAVVPAFSQPNWLELNPQQRQILTPLAGEWDAFEPYRRKKWLGIAERYPSMSAEEQERIQRRMKEWVRLSPEQRKIAREKYKSLKNAPADKQQAVKEKWQEYKELSDEDKQRLQQQAATKPVPKSAAGKSISTGRLPSPLAPPAPPVTPLQAVAPLAPPAQPSAPAAASN
ncbi:MAG: DUF3106 domain-containing protein [Rhodocyclaceae bacterium]|nr:DUF3106 domain-containing protein [Rhodocyclaceae bacterium]